MSELEERKKWARKIMLKVRDISTTLKSVPCPACGAEVGIAEEDHDNIPFKDTWMYQQIMREIEAAK